MGNKLVIFGLYIILPFSLFSQIKKIEADAKGYLYYCCIKGEYNTIDSNNSTAYNKDYSGSYFIQMTDLSMQIMDSLYLYYQQNIIKYRGVPQESSFDTTANMGCLSCWKLCEAKDTRKYIKRITKKKN